MKLLWLLQPKVIGKIAYAQWYKSVVTTYARKNKMDFDWQPKFHDHIIQSMEEYERISTYIINNTSKWKEHKLGQE